MSIANANSHFVKICIKYLPDGLILQMGSLNGTVDAARQTDGTPIQGA